jgi:multiple sugar transport system substrate-binding protein
VEGIAVTRRVFVGAGAALLASGCGGGDKPARLPFGSGAGYDGPKVTLDFWTGFTGGDGDAMIAIIEEFQAEHPNIAVAMNTIRWEDFYTKVPAAVSSGRGPDLAVMHVDQLATGVEHETIVPLDQVAAALELRESDFAPDVWRAGEYRGRRYGIPLDMHPLGLYYNKAVLDGAGLDAERPPQTRDDYMAALEELKARGIRGHWMTPFFFTGGLQFQSLVWQFGGDLWSEDGTRAAWSSDAGIQAVDWMLGLIRDGYSPPSVGQDADNIAFKNGQNAFIWNGSWGCGDYGATEGLEWGAAPLPVIGDEPAAWSNSHNFVVMRQSEPDRNRLRASVVFIDGITRRAAQWAEGGQVPARRGPRESKAFAKLEGQSQLARQVPYLRFSPPVPGISDVRESTLDLALQQALAGDTPARQALEESAKRADELLRLNREKFAA